MYVHSPARRCAAAWDNARWASSAHSFCVVLFLCTVCTTCCVKVPYMGSTFHHAVSYRMLPAALVLGPKMGTLLVHVTQQRPVRASWTSSTPNVHAICLVSRLPFILGDLLHLATMPSYDSQGMSCCLRQLLVLVLF